MNQIKRIFIVGHSGAGKGVLAQGVAEQLGWKFVDADFSLAPSIGRNAKDILGSQGEQLFLQSLADILSAQCKEENIVVTTDDSLICLDKNRTLLANEFTVNLKVSTAVQLTRIGHNRPLIPNKDFKAFLDNLHKERNALYEEVASLTVNSDDNDLEGHIAIVVKAVKNP